MSKKHTVQPLQQQFAQETGAAAIHIVRHSSITATVASAADGLFSAVTDLVFGHGFGRGKRSRSASGAADAGSNGTMMTTGPADASGPLAQPAIKRHHTAPAPLSLTPTTAAGPTVAAQPRHNLTSTAAGVPLPLGTTPIVGVAAPTIPIHKQDQHIATATGQRSLPVIRTPREATARSSDVITPTTPEAKAAAGLLELAATPIATTKARSSKETAARSCKVAAAPCLPLASLGLWNHPKQ